LTSPDIHTAVSAIHSTKKGNGLDAVLIRFIAITLLRSNGAISKTDWLTGLPKAKQLTKKTICVPNMYAFPFCKATFLLSN
jgi:hypothetical protein